MKCCSESKCAKPGPVTTRIGVLAKLSDKAFNTGNVRFLGSLPPEIDSKASSLRYRQNRRLPKLAAK